MEKVEDIDMENHDAAGSDNIEQSQKIKLAEMPVEILERILVHLDDKSLLRASHVCTKFAAVAETAFTQKYSNEYYMVEGYSIGEVMLSKYGDKIRKLEINVNEKDEKMLDLAERVCCNLSSLYLSDSLKMIHPTGLREVRLENVQQLNRASFTEFINNNQQLEILRLDDNKADLLDVLNGLNKLKTLEYTNFSRSVNNLPTINLVALEKLELFLSNRQDYNYARALRAITCDELKSLSIFGGHIDLPENVIDQICTFRTLVSLKLGYFKVTKNQLKALAQQIPHLTEFGMGTTENVDHAIQMALRILPKLTKLSIGLDDDSYRELCDDLEGSIHDIHTHFVVSNTEIELVYEESIVSISNDRTFAFVSNTETFELLCMENLSEESVRKVLNGATKEYLIGHLKITNDCDNATLDVSKFMHECFHWTDTVDIKSKGPITVNANATRLSSFFPDLKVLKIQLENNSVINLLENMSKHFCMRIKELIIDIKDAQINDADQEMEHGNDITHILAKFENLKSLHVTTSAINFDAKHLMSVCPNLNKLCVQRHSDEADDASQ